MTKLQSLEKARASRKPRPKNKAFADIGPAADAALARRGMRPLSMRKRINAETRAMMADRDDADDYAVEYPRVPDYFA